MSGGERERRAVMERIVMPGIAMLIAAALAVGFVAFMAKG